MEEEQVEYLEVKSQVTKEAYELGQGLSKLVASIKIALDDGWDTAQDLPTILSSAVMDLVPGIQGADKISNEISKDPTAFAKGVGLCTADITALFLKKEEEVSQ